MKEVLEGWGWFVRAVVVVRADHEVAVRALVVAAKFRSPTHHHWVWW